MDELRVVFGALRCGFIDYRFVKPEIEVEGARGK